jgi:eIF-2B alpha/beta/delta-like uncharacterized protein
MKPQKFKDIVRQIKTLRIQGAEGVAREGTRSLLYVLKSSHAVTKDALLAELYRARDQLLAVRPTEPCLRHALFYVLYSLHTEDDAHSLSKAVGNKIDEVVHYFETTHERIAKRGAAKVRHHSVVFTHCHSTSVVGALVEAHRQGKRFIVYNTETRPMWQELAKAGIPVKHFVDSAAMVAMKDVHVAFLGADAITRRHVYNKIGSGMFAELLASRHIPLYICTNSWKFDPSTQKGYHKIVEERDDTEVWKEAPQKVEVENPAFEAIEKNNISAIISELGTLSFDAFLQEVQRKNNWMFK